MEEKVGNIAGWWAQSYFAAHPLDAPARAARGDSMTAPERIWLFADNLRQYLPGGGKIMMGDTEYVRADLAARDLAAALARIADLEAKADRAEDELVELRRQLGGGCQANSGNDHLVIKQGSYSFCGNCGESLRGVRFCHLPPAP